MAAAAGRRGTLRIYLGAAPGVGKTFAMLNEAHRRRGRGTDVAVALVETHDRPKTAEQVGDLEVIPRRRLTHQGAEFDEMDVDAVLARHPDLALVDELAHTNVPGSRNEKRWQDVEELLDAGIDVLSTVNVQHLESLNDVVERITGVRQRETVPDHVVRAAEQVELVDMTPEALRRRMAHGNIYPAARIDAALGNYFRLGNLGALRELALLWVADRVDDALEDYRERHGITEPWELRERVIVAVTGAPGTEHLIRRAARLARRTKGELIGVHVTADSGLTTEGQESVAAHRELLEKLEGEFREVVGADVALALIDVARAENATQIVLGASRRSRLQRLTQGSVISRVVANAGPIDVHVISEHATDAERLALPLPRRVLTPLSPTRQAWGWGLAAVGLPIMTEALSNLRGDIHLPTVLLIYLAFGMLIALVGGWLPALAAVVAGFLLVDYYFTEPLYDLSIDRAEIVVSLVVYLLAAGIVAVLVDRLGRTRLQAARSHAEAEAMAALAGSLAEAEALPGLVAHLRTTFGMKNAALFARTPEGWVVEASAGAPTPARPEDAEVRREIGTDLVLTLSGRTLRAADEGVLSALASQLTTAVEARRLAGEADRAEGLAAANELRGALLQAVSHDLRTPLAGIKASISSLRQRGIAWTPDEIAEFQQTIEEEADRLDGLIEKLLDMSRLQSGSVQTQVTSVALDGVVLTALAGLGERAARVAIEVDEDLPPVLADRALLERVVANLVDNALKMSPPELPVRVEAGTVPTGVDLRVVDQGPGVARSDRERVFEPFQRTTDHGTGVGLGLAITRGFLDAMGAEITLEDTPGGGLTAVVRLRRADRSAPCGPAADVPRVLVVDDEEAIVRALRANLKARGYEVDLASTGEQALDLVARRHPDAVILDLGLPGMDGQEVVRGLRGWTRVPIIILSARSDEAEKVAALDAGADDYVPKPFGMDELMARLRAALRRAAPAEEQPRIDTAAFRIDLAAKTVTRGDDDLVHLTPIEWSLLEILVRNPGRLVSQRHLLQEVWGPEYGEETNYLRVHLAHLRSKLEPETARPRYFITEPGMGYRFEPERT